MKNKWNKLSQPSKTMILVWSPIIIIGIIYSALYLGFYINAKNIENKYQAYANSCIYGSHSGTPWVLSSPGITPGLGLPEFTGDGGLPVSSSEIPSPNNC